ncbi:MAG: glycosyltransferase, partial [Patescibacteria group bacterium]
MKVLFVANDPGLLVEGSSVYMRMKTYAAAIGTLHIVTAAKEATELHEGSLHFYGVVCTKLTRVRALAEKAHEIIAQEGIEVVSAQDPFEHGLAALRAVRGTNAKLHIQVHTDFLSPWFARASPFPLSLLNFFRVRIAGRVLPRASGIRVVSERISASLTNRYGARIPVPQVIAIQVASMVPEPVPLPEHSFSFALITVGRIEPEKRIKDIILALNMVRDTCPEVGLIVVGKGTELGRLQKQVASLHLEDRVVFTNDWRTDAWGLVRSSQGYIQASAYEGYGRTLIEAALAGVPIITTDVGIVGEVFTGKGDALVAPVCSPQSLAIHIRTLVSSFEVPKQVGSAGRIAATKHLAETDSSAAS